MSFFPVNAIRHWFSDESGQDLIEYALLSGFIGLAAVAVFDALTGTMGNAYTQWSSPLEQPGLTEMPDPAPAP
jgi:Flp pilus assembly pilin Flp